MSGDGSHSHRIFPQDLAEGTYVAARFLFDVDSRDRCGILLEENGQDHSKYFLPVNSSCLVVRDYAPPSWFVPESLKPEECAKPRRPVTWLSVLGRDAFWPVAEMEAAIVPEHLPPNTFVDRLAPSCPPDPKCEKPTGEEKPKESFWKWLGSSWGTLSGRISSSCESFWKMTVLFHLHLDKQKIISASDSDEFAPVGHPWPHMPVSMKICLALVLLLALFQLYCCALPSLTIKPSYRAHFVQVDGISHLALVIIGSALVTLASILLGWGYGAMSLTGEPVDHAWLYRAFLPLIWMVGGIAVLANTWFGSPWFPRWTFYPPTGSQARSGFIKAHILWSRITSTMKIVYTQPKLIYEIAGPLFCYFAVSCFLFWLIAFFLVV